MKALTILRLRDMEEVDSVPEGYAAALGVFDGVHRGHAEVVSAAKRLGGGQALVWTIRSGGDPLKGGGLLTDEKTKLRLLRDAGVGYAALSDFDAVRGLSGDEFFREMLLGTLRVSAVVCGRDFRFGRGAVSDASELEAMCNESGIGFEAVGDVRCGGASISSTRIRKLLKAGNVEEADVLLGRPFSISGEVVSGKRLGRTLGFPTANILPSPYLVLPARGVYATLVSFAFSDVSLSGGSIVLPGVTNVGICPTVETSGSGSAICETHIIGSSENLYGTVIEVSFLRRLRDEIKFPSIDDLKAQIKADSENAASIARQYLKCER